MKKNDIVICVTDKMYGQKQTLKIGEQYRVDDFIEMTEKNLVSVYYETDYVGVFDDKHFIPLDVWREFQLRKLLD